MNKEANLEICMTGDVFLLKFTTSFVFIYLYVKNIHFFKTPYEAQKVLTRRRSCMVRGQKEPVKPIFPRIYYLSTIDVLNQPDYIVPVLSFVVLWIERALFGVVIQNLEYKIRIVLNFQSGIKLFLADSFTLLSSKLPTMYDFRIILFTMRRVCLLLSCHNSILAHQGDTLLQRL